LLESDGKYMYYVSKYKGFHKNIKQHKYLQHW